MTVSFHIEYRTSWGEEVRLLGSVPELGNNIPHNAILLQTVDGINWTLDKEVQIPTNQVIEYNYYIFKDGNIIRNEWDSFPRKIFLSPSTNQTYRVYASWKNLPEDLYFYSSAFTESISAHSIRANFLQNYNKGLVIKAYAPRISANYVLCICGNQEALGNWNPDKALFMSDINFPEWQIEFDASQITYPLEYKFLLYSIETDEIECWENNPNRYIGDYQISDEQTVIISDRYVYFDIPAWKGAGVAIPVFSLRSETSFGIGDFGDLKKMIDWAVKTDQKIVQILPINDTTMTGGWTDSYPYNSISIYAFHPIYTNIDELGKLKDENTAKAFADKQKELNALPMLNYEAVSEAKWEYFRLIFAQEGEEVLASDDFRSFFETNKEWLKPYAAFSYLRDVYKTPNFREWPVQTVYNSKQIDELIHPGTPEYKDIAIYYYIQYNLHLQLLEATLYARAHGIVLKGDIPIGISRNSVEAWTEPYYFNLNGQAGAPPDDFSVNGQN